MNLTVAAAYDDDDDDDDDGGDVYLELQQGKEFRHNLVYMSYVKHINPANKA